MSMLHASGVDAGSFVRAVAATGAAADVSAADVRAGGVALAERMWRFVDEAWARFGVGAGRPGNVSWIGFYVGPGVRVPARAALVGAGEAVGEVAGPEEMLLGPRRDKPACSPIGLHGACGRSWRERATLVVTDVKHLGENYVACDPRDRAELVLPLMSDDGSCWGVLDADSFDVRAFDEADAAVMLEALRAAGLTSRQWTPAIVVV